MRSIRKFVGRGTLALGISAVVALAVAVQAGQAARIENGSQVASSAQVTKTSSVQLHFTLTSPSPACTTAISGLQAAFAKDVTEDVSERSANATDTETGADLTEDTGEKAALKPLFAAVRAACGTTREGHRAPIIAKTPACASALQAARTAFEQARTEQMTEITNGTEGTAADQTEDQTEAAHIQSLWSAVKAACSTTSTSGTSTTFSTWWEHR